MLYYLLAGHPEWFGAPDSARMLLVRAFLAAGLAAAVGRIAIPITIRLLLRRGLTEPTRDILGLDPSSKKGVPILGGVAILAALFVSVLFCCEFLSPAIIVVSGYGLAFGAIGFADDAAKLRKDKRGVGLSQKQKYLAQAVLAGLLALLLLSEAYLPIRAPATRAFALPFCSHTWVLPVWAGLIVVPGFLIFSANAVNITDGMDGLATVPVMLAAAALALLAGLLGEPGLAGAFHLQALPECRELIVFLGALIGACGAFLWFNAFPASIFMGDTGSLALGGILGATAVLLRQELFFLVAGGVFVLEGLSSCLQSYLGVGLLGRRLFFRAPLHHNWQYQGASEPKVVARFWLLAMFFAALALLALELRR